MTRRRTNPPAKAGDVTKRGNRIDAVRPAGPDHQVITVSVKAGDRGYMRKPCATCPWRVDATGEFPAEAFRHSAPTAYDQAMNVFACHTAGADHSKTCAGFVLRGAAHNIGARLAVMRGQLDRSQVSDGGHELHANYRAMAEASGVDPDDPVLRPCRSD